MKAPAFTIFSVMLAGLWIGAVLPAWADETPVVGVLAAATGMTERRGENSAFEPIAMGERILLNDEIRTSDNSRIQILLMDETTFSMGANSTIVIDRFIYDPATRQGQVSAEIKKGVFRFISGRIAKLNPENMKVTAGNAVISIMGTEVIGTIDDDQSTIVLLSGMIDMNSISVGCGGGASRASDCQSSLVRPGFGVALDQEGRFSEPTRFDPEEITAVIQSLDTNPRQKEDQSEEEKEEKPSDDDQAEGDPETKTETETQEPEPDNKDDEDPARSSPAISKDEQQKPEETALPTQASGVDENKNPAPAGDLKVEDEGKTRGASAFDLIVMRSFGIIDDTAKDDEKTAMNDISKEVTTAEKEEIEEDKKSAGEDETNDTKVEDKVTDAVKKLEDEKEESRQAFESNNAPTLSVLGRIDLADTSADDTFSASSDDAEGSDEDGDALSYSVTGMASNTSRSGYTHAASGSFGVLYINQSSGAYVFVPDDTAIEKLTDDTTETFSITVSDSRKSASQTLTIGVTGVNDTPQLSVISSVLFDDTSAADSFSTSSDNLDATDRDDGQSFAYSVIGASADTSRSGYTHSLAGDYGTLYLNASSGAYAYVPSANDIEALTASETGSDSFTLTVSDGAASASQTLTASVTGANDTPVFASVSAPSFTDTQATDSFSNQTGSVSASDVDTGDTVSYTLTGSSAVPDGDPVMGGYDIYRQGTYGRLAINQSSGAYLFVPDATAINARASDTTESFTIGATDGSASSSSALQVSITGVDDAPVINPGSSTQNSATSASGLRVPVSDAEGDTISDTSSGLPAWLSFVVNTDSEATQYYWEVGVNAPAWLNGQKAVTFNARANGLDASAGDVTFVYSCTSDECDNYAMSSDTETPLTVRNSTDINAIHNNGEYTLSGENYWVMSSREYNAMFSGFSGTGQFRNVATENENGGNGTWDFDQTVLVNYSSRSITVNGTITGNSVGILGGETGSFTYTHDIDPDNLLHTGTPYGSADSDGNSNFTMDDFKDQNGVVDVTLTDTLIFSIHSSNSDGYPYNLLIQTDIKEDGSVTNANVTEWRSMEPQ